MIESARREAIDVLLDQRLFVLDPERYDAFMRSTVIPRRDRSSGRYCAELRHGASRTV